MLHKLRFLTILTLLNIGCMAFPKSELYTQRATLPEDATTQQKIDIASRIVPSDKQLAWQQMELTAFLHFGINTFTDNEWGDGADDPALFNPTNLDCEQWVRTLKEGGFKMAILTAKHHDGFCLWQTETTEYSVKHSPWCEGRGDVVRELSEACREHGLKFGVYISPWDRNAPSYGDSPAYNRLFIAQLSELLTNYGIIDEVWLDGACGEGPNGKRQIYDWDAILQTIHTLQPDAVTAIMGDDVRWVGNERGLGRTTEWSVTPFTPMSYNHSEATNHALDISETAKDLGSRELIVRATQLYWYPSEVDVSIRPGWFYHEWQNDQVRSLANLVDIYFNSVGCNSVLLLNIPPDRRGLIHEIDVKRVKEFASYITQMYSKNYICNSQTHHCNDGDSIILSVENGVVVNTLLLAEDIAQGQHIESFKVEALINNQWHYLTDGTTIGYKRLLRFSDCTPTKIKITILSTRATAHISNVELYYATPLHDTLHKPQISDIATDGWRAQPAEAQQAIDGDITTTWRTEGLVPIEVDMDEVYDISGFCYAPTMEVELSGTIYRYNFYISTDGKIWKLCDTSGEFSNIKNNPVPHYVHFGRSYTARYFKLETLEEIEGRAITSIGEIGVLTTE